MLRLVLVALSLAVYGLELAPFDGLAGELTVEQIAVHVEPGR
jgi:hypothetical protein